MRKLFTARDKKGRETLPGPPSGLKVLANPENPVADIVFIHGLNGHQEETWRHSSQTISWPEAFLSHSIPDVRIMAYGYDSRVADWKGFLNKVSIYGVQQQSQTLLETLASYRADQKTSHRAIIFVCHSLGGIVCKDALVRSRTFATEAHIAAICQCTRGIIFLGTPHSGAQIAGFSHTLATIVGLVKHTNTANLRELRKGSSDLKRIQEEFDQHLRSRALWQLSLIEVKCFYEERPTTGIGDVVVSYDSAILAGTIPAGIDKDHREMTRFESAEDRSYKIIEFTIQRWLQKQQDVRNMASTIAISEGTSVGSTAGGIPFRNQDTPSSTRSTSPRSLSSGSSSGSSFVKIPPSGKFLLNESLVKLPFEFIPPVLRDRQSRHFQSREKELRQIETALFPSRLQPHNLSKSTHQLCTITGLGGVGKTELSYRFYTRFKDNFDVIFFTVADSETRLREQYSQIATNLGLVDPIDEKDSETSSELFRLWLADPIKGVPDGDALRATVKWLLVLDNATSADTIDKFWPAGNSGKIIITSRNPLIAPYELFNFHSISLKGLPREDAVKLLQDSCNESRRDVQSIEDADDIVKWVEGFPLAIKQLGSIIHDQHLTISQFRRVWSTKDKLLRQLHHIDGKKDNLVTLWALDSLYANHKPSFELLGVLSLLDPELIPQKLLVAELPHSECNDVFGDEVSYIAARKLLVDNSLIDVSRETGDLRIHRLVQSLTRDVIVQNGQAAIFFKMAIGHVASIWPFLNRNYVNGTATTVTRWKGCSPVFPHILHLRDVYQGWTELRVVGLADMDLTELLLEAVQYCNERGVGHEAIVLVETVIKMSKIMSPFIPSSIMQEHMAQVYRARIGLAISSREGDDVFEFAQHVFEIEKHRYRTGGVPSSMLAVAYNDLATGWAFRKEWITAIKLLKESKDIREKLPGFTRDKLFSPLYHLGIVYHHQGDFNSSESILMEAIEDRAAAFGPKDTLSVRSAALHYALGNMRLQRADRNRGDLMGGLAEFKLAVDIAATCMGTRNRTTLLCQYQVARASVLLQDYATARDLLSSVLEKSIDSTMYERDTARMSYLYAHCLYAQDKQDKREEALAWLGKSLSIHNKKRVGNQKTLEQFCDTDIDALIPYDFL